jgi:hypothetical protein
MAGERKSPAEPVKWTIPAGCRAPQTRCMRLRPARRSRPAPNQRRVLLVGLPPLSLNALEPALRKSAQVLSVPFPGASFDRAVEEFDADMVVVDVTYLDEARVRPLIASRFASSQPILIFVADGAGAWMHDFQAEQSIPLKDSSISGLVALASASPLRLVAER